MVAAALIASALLVPLALALAVLSAEARGARWLARAASLASLPMLLVAVVPGSLSLDVLVLGMHLGPDETSRPFLLAAGLIWLAAGWHAARQFDADPTAWRYWLFHLITLAANAGVLLARDLLSLYIWYALMTFAVYGLVVHDRERASLRAGRIYMILAIGAETVLIAAVLMVGARLGNVPLERAPALIAAAPDGQLISALLFAGFALKMGTMPLHVWLPLAHPRAPVPASAVLSALIVKAGLLGWLRLLPQSVAGYETLGQVAIGLGFLSAFGAALLGLTQRDPKVVLAYSTVSQMGLITAIFGAALTWPAGWQVSLQVLLLFALHHAFAKGALFLGVGTSGPWRRRLMLWPAIAIAGAPLTSGALAKSAAKSAAVPVDGLWGIALDYGLVFSSVLTALLMLHLLRLVWQVPGPDSPAARRNALPCALLVVLSAVGAFVWAWPRTALFEAALTPAALWGSTWPIIVAGALGYIGWRRVARMADAGWRVPEGDIVVVFERLTAFAAGYRPMLRRPEYSARAALARLPLHAAVVFDRRRLRLAAAGGLLLAGALLLALAVLG
jgi:formate hydrogenlyase subunit 3/multisubunit Na+/H+ antiporter MnhD subunit